MNLENFTEGSSDTMDVGSGKSYPAGKLSNFSPNKFIFDGVLCGSLEGALQSFKFENSEMQEFVCTMVGYAAKKKGSKKNWKRTQTLYWKGVAYPRKSKEYQDLLTSLYDACFEQCENFRNALAASGNAVFTHSIGKSKETDTILTEREFCSQLTRLRNKLKG